VQRQDKAAEHARELANGAGIECGCCFGEEVMVGQIGLAVHSPSRGDCDHGSAVARMWLVLGHSLSHILAMVSILVMILAMCHLSNKC
jgi:hypothetical protein